IRPTAPLPPPAPFVDPPPGDHGWCELKNNNCKVVYAKHLDIEVVDASEKKIRRKWTDGDPVAPPLTTGGPLYIGKLTPRSTTAQEAGAATPQLLPFPKPGPLPVKLSLQTTEGLPLDGYPIALRRENGEEQAARTDAEGVANFKVQGSGWAAVLTDAGSASPRRTLAGDPFRPEEVGDDEVRQRRVQPLPGPTGLCAELGEYKQGNRLLVPKGGR
ncbi:MAG TPA: hypothetical protein PKW90_28115, partial [Myxococcota bacterium]|nr:hypothetical protein [Myxococcota bacterium]